MNHEVIEIPQFTSPAGTVQVPLALVPPAEPPPAPDTSAPSGDVQPPVEAKLPEQPKKKKSKWRTPVSTAGATQEALTVEAKGLILKDGAPETVDVTLRRILSWKRPFESKAEIEFMSWLHGEIKSRGAMPEIKGKGNVVVEIKRKDGKSSATMFSCHTDTVHHEANPPQQGLVYDQGFGHIFLDKEAPGAGSCLGADDGAGVWLCLEMIKAKVPGTYVFHRGEERGGVGAQSLLTTESKWLGTFDAAIAFDRRDNDEVITHQGGLRCASDKFGTALAKALNEAGGFDYRLSQNGTFTDTKLYRGVIDECVNLSCGYNFQHTQSEFLDYDFITKLRDAVVKVDWDALPVDRDCKKAEAPKYGDTFSGSWQEWQELERRHERQYAQWGAAPKARSPAPTPAVLAKAKPAVVEPPLYPEDHFRDTSRDDLIAWLEGYPDEAAGLVLELAAATAALRAELNFWKGAV